MTAVIDNLEKTLSHRKLWTIPDKSGILLSSSKFSKIEYLKFLHHSINGFFLFVCLEPTNSNLARSI